MLETAVAWLRGTDGCVHGSLGLVSFVDPRVAQQGFYDLPGALQPQLGSSFHELGRNLILPLTTQLDLDIQVLPGLQGLGVLVITARGRSSQPSPRAPVILGPSRSTGVPGAVSQTWCPEALGCPHEQHRAALGQLPSLAGVAEMLGRVAEPC